MPTPHRLTRTSFRTLSSGPVLSVLLPILGLGWTVGCGDDSEDRVATGGSSGTGSGGKGGSAGKSGSAGKGGTSGDAGADTGGTGGKGGGKGGTAGKAGTAGTGGTTAGTGGSSGSGDLGGAGSDGQAGDGVGGTGGTGGTGVVGNAGEGGNGGEAGDGTGPLPEIFAPITSTGSLLVTGVHDLRGLVYAASGKIYATGHVGVDNGNDVATGTDRLFAIVRFNANGTLDTTFGTNGIKTHNLVVRALDSVPAVVNNGNEESLGVVQLASGEFLATVNARDSAGKGQDVLLVKFDEAGELVTAFGTNGLKRVDFGWVDETDNATYPTANTTPSDTAWGLRLDSSTPGTEKVVIFGFGPPAKVTTGTQRVDNDRYLVRVLTSDGSIDPGFNDGKVFTLNSGGTFADGGRRGIVLADGSILSAGYTNFGEGLGNHILVIKLGPNGKPAPGFRYGISLPGVSRYNPFITDGGAPECYQLGVQSTGRIVTTGYGRATGENVLSSFGWATTTKEDMISVGLLPSGAPDLTFGVSGAIAVQSELSGLTDTEDRGRDLVVLPDDRIVYAGRFGTSPAIFVAKPNGDLDDGSGVDGRFMYEPLVQASPPITTSHFFAIAKSANERSLVATTSNNALGVRVAFLSVAATP